MIANRLPILNPHRSRLPRRQFIAVTGLALGSFAATPPSVLASGPSELIFWSATQLAAAIRDKKVSAVEAVQAYLKRIEQVNPKINAVVTLCAERALAEARLADKALASGQNLGPLHGVPFTIKDSLETAGVRSTSGTLGRASYIPQKDATVVARVRAAGAILLGKSNTPEFTMGGGSRGTSNLVFGQTYNPYSTAHSPAGSSGGAGAIVAAGGAAFDIGSDLGGSVRLPAHANGIAGIKPTSGRTPRTGHVPGYGGLFDSWQQLGPLARRVEDLALLMPLICGEDMQDAFCYDVPLGDPSQVRIQGLRVAYYTDNGVFTPSPETQALVNTAASWLKDAGATVTQDIHPNYKADYELSNKAREGEGGAWQTRLLKRYGTSVADPGLLRRISGKPAPTPEFLELMEEVDHARSRMLQWMRSYDVILCPTSALPAARLDQAPPPETNYTRIYNVTGWPATVVRGATSPEGLPIGIQIVAKPWRDDVALAVAQLVEEKTGGCKQPSI
jgi:amidase